MLLCNNVFASLDTDFSDLKPLAAKFLGTAENDIISASLYRKSVDARRGDVRFCLSLLLEVKNEKPFLKRNKNVSVYTENIYEYKKAAGNKKVYIAGFGPAGMFAALTLCRAGLQPVVLERGKAADERKADTENFFSGGKLDPESNVQFGEGGAGTFSDGKLNTGIKDARLREILKVFVGFGADKSILTDAKPHIGTDVLINVVKNIRAEILRLGGEVRFSSKLTDVEIKNGRLTAVYVGGVREECDALILAIGHSARDTFVMLNENGFAMCRKPFSAGVRIEHLQKDINKALYGDKYDHPALKNADYKAAVHLENGRGVYTFCMCPGGRVINSTSEEKTLTVNGMSYAARDGENANSAVLTDVRPEDFPGDDVLAGFEFQRKIEKAAYKIGNGAVPVTAAGAFLRGEKNVLGRVKPTVGPSYVLTDFSDIFPPFIISALKEGIPLIAGKIKGFDCSDAVLTAPETRSSSPVRILRTEKLCSQSVSNVYPAGEGAGYAGGIMSAAADGMKCAEAIIDEMNGF